MTTATCSTVLDQPPETVWALIRDFDNYPAYIEGVTESVIEDGRRGDEVGAVRRFRYGDAWLRQRLEAHSDAERYLTYAGLEPFAYPDGLQARTPSPAVYRGTIRLRPVSDGDRSFLEWSVTVEAPAEDASAWQSLLSGLIADWAGSLRRALARGA
jgi:hypothetical protein